MEIGPVRPDNTPRRRPRRDPDDPPVAAAPMPTLNPPAPAPAPAPQPTPPEPVAAPPSSPSTVALTDPAPTPPVPARPDNGADMLAGMLASNIASNTSSHSPPVDEPADTGPAFDLDSLLAMRAAPVDPMEDFQPDGTRQLAFIQDAVDLVSAMTGRTKQVIYRDAVLGVQPIPPAILDRAFFARYRTQRPR